MADHAEQHLDAAASVDGVDGGDEAGIDAIVMHPDAFAKLELHGKASSPPRRVEKLAVQFLLFGIDRRHSIMR